MIDTDKYEGHTPRPWKWFAERPLEVALIGDLNSCADTEGGSRFILDQSSWGENPNQDALLIADAPLLLQEVKRLQKEHDTVRGWFLDIDNYMMEHHYDMWQEIRKEIGLDD